MDQAESAQSGKLAEGQLYEIDGGVFRAKFNGETGQFELWTHQGKAGYVVARTGFNIDAAGVLHDRVYDVMAEEHIFPVPPRFTVDDLQPAQGRQVLGKWTQRLAQQRADTAQDVDIWER